MSAYESCYVFTPDESDHPTTKRRKSSHIGRTDRDASRVPLVPLLNGQENVTNLQRRGVNFDRFWSGKGKLINETLRLANDDIVDQIVSFVGKSEVEGSNERIPTFLVVAGPGDNDTLDFASVLERISIEKRNVLIQLDAGQSPNLKTILKYINQHVANNRLTDDEEVPRNRKPNRILNYDLQMLYDHVQQHSISKILLVFRDSEAFDGALLADLIEVLKSWNDRIPFVLLFNITTSIDLFQSKLPRDTLRTLTGASFHVKRIDTDQMFQDIHYERPALFFGNGISSQILEQQRDHIQSSYAFVQNLKYAYMTHFFANPLSILCDDEPTTVSLQKEHFEAIRSLPSFRIFAQALIDKRDYHTVRRMLDDDEMLKKTVIMELDKSQQQFKDLLSSLEILCKIQTQVNRKAETPWIELYVQAMSGSLTDSTALDNILISTKKLPSDAMASLLATLLGQDLVPTDLAEELQEIKTDLLQLTSGLKDLKIPLKSSYDIHHSTLRTTVVAQKVSLSKNSSKLSSEDTAYTKIVDQVYSTLSNHCQRTIINPSDLFLNEVFIYDTKSPHREVFAARPRFGIERALSTPHDYLGCECCSSGQGTGLEASQPPIAILYQLYLESGSIINAADLWEAFRTIVGAEDAEDEEEEKQRVLTLFSRALAELRYMGMIKSSKKKADHLTKLAWQGL